MANVFVEITDPHAILNPWADCGTWQRMVRSGMRPLDEFAILVDYDDDDKE